MKGILKKSISLFLVILMILSITPTSVITKVFATGDSIEWNFDGENLIVSGYGDLSSSYTSTDAWKSMKDKCVTVCIEGEINIIDSNSFRDFTAIKKVDVLSEIKTVGEYAFSGCFSLEEINLPDCVTKIDSYAFFGCSALKDFKFPQSLVKINKWAFQGCNCFDNKPLVLPDTLMKVALGAFCGADITSLTAPFVGLGHIDYEDGGKVVTSDHIGFMFGDVSFDNSYGCYESFHRDVYYVPNSLKEVTITKYLEYNNFENARKIEKITIKDTLVDWFIPTSFVKNCTSLKELVIEDPGVITSIFNSAFEGCTALESFTIPENVTEICSKAFYQCKFDSIIIPNKVETIEDSAFYGCQNIESVVFPDSVTSIGDYAFKGCTKLKYVTLPNNLEFMGRDVFAGTEYLGGIEDEFIITENDVLISYLGTDTEVVVPAGVKRIGSAFRGRSEITSILLPDGLQYISKYSFDGCSGLTELIIPDTVLVIESYAFHDCSHIKELVIPDSVVEIQSAAFAGICKLETLTVPFVGKNRDVASDTKESLLSYWFGTKNDHKCVYNCYGFYEEIKQTYNDGYYANRVCKPNYFKNLVVTGSVIKKGALSNFKLKSLTLGENVEAIEKYAADKSGIEELHIDPNIKITEIPDYAFTNNNLTSITIPGSVKRIGKAFICSDFTKNKLAEINLSEGLEVIDGSFAGARITSIDLPDSLIEILRESFYCTKLEYIEFPKNLTTIGWDAFEHSALKEVVLSDSIKIIYGGAFSDCPIKKVVVPEGMESIVEKTFGNCEELEIVVIGGNVTEIGDKAFENCGTLEAIVIPDSVVSISSNAFENANEDMVIYCNEGSYAQQYAVQNNIKYTTLVLDAIPNQMYTGVAIEPAVKAKVNNRQLVLNSEYKLSYSDNINVGVANVTAKGMGDYKHLIAKGKFNILARQLEKVAIDYKNFAYYSPGGTKPELRVYIDNNMLVEGKDYEIVGLDKITGIGTYNIAVKGMGNLIGTQNYTIKVLPRSITEARVSSLGDVKVTYSQYTLIEGVDYRVENRTDNNGVKATYIVGMGNFTDEKRISSTEPSVQGNVFSRLFALLERFFGLFKGLFK